LKYIIPAQAGQESVAMLKAFKANAPAETFGLVLETIKKELVTDRYNSLLSHLS
jgi:Mlc titration factor MtfA (ptsG expression regulator)